MAEAPEGSCKALLALSNNPVLRHARDIVLETLSDGDMVKVVNDIWGGKLSRNSRKANVSQVLDFAAKEAEGNSNRVPESGQKAQLLPHEAPFETLETARGRTGGPLMLETKKFRGEFLSTYYERLLKMPGTPRSVRKTY